MHSDSVKTMTMRFGKDVIELASGIPNMVTKCWNTVASPWCSQASHAIGATPDKPGPNTEITYTYRYVIDNGRAEGPRWSVRQTAVYQRVNMETGCSTWILIQPNDIAMERFKTICLRSQDNIEQPMVPHLAFLSAAQMGWKPYIRQLRLSLQGLVRCTSTAFLREIH